ncbi:PssD/Cps14F family polysaccharide biosynthesis glycosyltransferase [Bacillus sp. FJAT-27986]|uniref:PssD/Cps14F family polysaccharide biosynthesis glycosyltransferase n=1 Tax=Bacillus sp. FJAT-27986 TaxID=1743146 RepID=UPI00080AE2AE|nr:PssD/Cps14F family polysaccharide biosynthesis glycosyltransferase [Bacillus sp. FJAT-27986]OCA84621.1 polysaccharide biosynthesis protein [Bacillus sp. FJAT-27986]
MKICFAASSGGHFEQLMMLFDLMTSHSSFIITEKTNYDTNTKGIKKYELSQINRKEMFFILKFIVIFFKSLKIFFEEKPDVIISTGALSTVPILLIGKIFKKKIIFIESFSKINSPTITGRIMYKIADLFIIQWEELRKFYPKAVYGGGIY